MRTVTTVIAALLGVALLPAPASAQHPVYRHYVACGLSQHAKPSHVCRRGRVKAAFFRSNAADVFYAVCVRFPTGAHECKPRQEAEQGVLYFNKITSNIPGRHWVSWFVKGKRVGVFSFRVIAKRPQRHGGRRKGP